MVNIKLGILEMVEKAREQIEEVEVEDAIAESKDSDCLIIDVRDVRERKRDGYIPESFHCPRGMIEFWLDPESVYFKEGKLDLNKEMVLFCAGGLRSALAAKSLKDMGFPKVSHIDGGFGAIKQSKFKIT